MKNVHIITFNTSFDNYKHYNLLAVTFVNCLMTNESDEESKDVVAKFD